MRSLLLVDLVALEKRIQAKRLAIAVDVNEGDAAGAPEAAQP